jgi:flavin reductase (DIM6/NTAB) family NADH-FMN oxidoreductase RutF
VRGAVKKVDLSKVYRLLYPSVPAIVAATHRGTIGAMPVVSIISLSGEPPLIGISSSPSHATLQTMVGSRRFSVSWLSSEHLKSMEFLGTSSGHELSDKLTASGLRYSLKGTPPVPILRDASACLICSMMEVKEVGDHQLVIARVEVAEAGADFEEYWTFNSYKPILYTGFRRPVIRYRRPSVRRPSAKGI